MVARVTGAPPAVERAPRRAGDPAILVAASDRAQRRLGWKRAFPSLEHLVRTAWGWHQSHPRGFGG
jgi:UDP-glucose 4-epimerase